MSGGSRCGLPHRGSVPDVPPSPRATRTTIPAAAATTPIADGQGDARAVARTRRTRELRPERLGEARACSVPTRRVLFELPGEDSVDARNEAQLAGERRRLLLELRHHRRRLGCTLEEGRPGETLVRDTRERVAVTLPVAARTRLDHLGRHVRVRPSWTAEPARRRVGRFGCRSNPEVGHVAVQATAGLLRRGRSRA